MREISIPIFWIQYEQSINLTSTCLSQIKCNVYFRTFLQISKQYTFPTFTPFCNLQVKSTTETACTGTRTSIPVSLLKIKKDKQYSSLYRGISDTGYLHVYFQRYGILVPAPPPRIHNENSNDIWSVGTYTLRRCLCYAMHVWRYTRVSQ